MNTYYEKTLWDGQIVLGKLYEGAVVAVTYANRTQAQRAADLKGGVVIQRGRPFFVRLNQPGQVRMVQSCR